MLAWSDVEKILSGGRYYWISTTDADGRPHLVQQWGAWVDDHLFFEGSERTHWAQKWIVLPPTALYMTGVIGDPEHSSG